MFKCWIIFISWSSVHTHLWKQWLTQPHWGEELTKARGSGKMVFPGTCLLFCGCLNTFLVQHLVRWWLFQHLCPVVVSLSPCGQALPRVLPSKDGASVLFLKSKVIWCLTIATTRCMWAIAATVCSSCLAYYHSTLWRTKAVLSRPLARPQELWLLTLTQLHSWKPEGFHVCFCLFLFFWFGFLRLVPTHSPGWSRTHHVAKADFEFLTHTHTHTPALLLPQVPGL